MTEREVRDAVVAFIEQRFGDAITHMSTAPMFVTVFCCCSWEGKWYAAHDAHVADMITRAPRNGAAMTADSDLIARLDLIHRRRVLVEIAAKDTEIAALTARLALAEAVCEAVAKCVDIASQPWRPIPDPVYQSALKSYDEAIATWHAARTPTEET